jgi:hypothetical protein
MFDDVRNMVTETRVMAHQTMGATASAGAAMTTAAREVTETARHVRFMVTGACLLVALAAVSIVFAVTTATPAG